MVGGSGLTGDINAVAGVGKAGGTASNNTAHGVQRCSRNIWGSGLGAGRLRHRHFFSGGSNYNAINGDRATDNTLVRKCSVCNCHSDWSDFIHT